MFKPQGQTSIPRGATIAPNVRLKGFRGLGFDWDQLNKILGTAGNAATSIYKAVAYSPSTIQTYQPAATSGSFNAALNPYGASISAGGASTALALAGVAVIVVMLMNRR